jgi:DNA-binding MarR family transcriptional regulator
MGSPPLELGTLQDVAAFRVALWQFEQETRDAVRRAGLTPRWYLLLLLIGARPADDPATVSTLSDDLAMPQSSVTDLVSRVVVNGLADRRASDADGRVAHLRLTAEGTRRLAQAVDSLRSDRAALRRQLIALSRLV